MNILFSKSSFPKNLEPLHFYADKIGSFPIAGETLSEQVIRRIEERISPFSEMEIKIRDDFWPSVELLNSISGKENFSLMDESGELLLSKILNHGEKLNPIIIDANSLVVKYPWDFLKINEEIILSFKENRINGIVRQGANIDGIVKIGEGSVLLPGVYIEGNATIGENCKIGPNCYIRGNTHIGDNCHIGQAVEIKNSIILDKVSIGHLSYIGDSIIAQKTNFGAGTVTANLRHDNKTHKSLIGELLLDTGRRKLGVIVGEEVHTGINTTIYPGRKLWPYTSTLPGEIVKNDKKN